MKIIPKRRLANIFLIPLIFVSISFFYEQLFLVYIAFNLVLIFFSILDLVLSLKTTKISIESLDNDVFFSLGRKSSLKMEITNETERLINLKAKLSYPEEIEDLSTGHKEKINPRSSSVFEFNFKPLRRGKYRLDYLYMRVNSIFSLFDVEVNKKLNIEIQVFPDIAQLKYYLKLVRRDRTHFLGINRNIWKGHGTELDSLREYRKDDDSKFIDWKASTRLNKPITKVFRRETNNNIVVAIDCGRLMTAEQDGITTMDHAVNSLLMLAYIVLDHGDILHITAFSDRIVSEISNIKGKGGMSRLTRFITRLKPEYVEPNYNLLFSHLQKKHTRRSLIFFLTDIIDDINYELLKKWTRALSKRHFTLFILLRDVILSTMAERTVKSTHGLFIQAASRDMYLRRDEVISRLKHFKVNIMDILPAELTGKIINKYLEIKSKNLI